MLFYTHTHVHTPKNDRCMQLYSYTRMYNKIIHNIHKAKNFMISLQDKSDLIDCIEVVHTAVLTELRDLFSVEGERGKLLIDLLSGELRCSCEQLARQIVDRLSDETGSI